MIELSANLPFIDFVQDGREALKRLASSTDQGMSLSDMQLRVLQFVSSISTTPGANVIRIWDRLVRLWSDFYCEHFDATSLELKHLNHAAELSLEEWFNVTSVLCAFGSNPFSVSSMPGNEAFPFTPASFLSRVVDQIYLEAEKLSSLTAERLVHALAHSLHPNFASVLVEKIKTCSLACLKLATQGTKFQQQLRSVHYALYILRHHLEAHVAYSFECTESIDFHDLLSTFHSFLQLLPLNAEFSRNCRILFCQFVALVVKHRDLITCSKDITLRNNFVDSMVSWIRLDFSSESSKTDVEIAALSLESLKALSQLLLNLPLAHLEGDDDESVVC